jgi:membrane-bound serine protease (ClpP class)
MGGLLGILIVFTCGLLAMVVELFVPGGVLGAAGLLVAVGCVIYAFATGNTVAGVVLTGVTILWLPIFILLLKSVAGRLLALKTDQAGYMPSRTVTDDLIGLEGVALTPLHPSGIARLGKRRQDVVTRGEMLDKGTRIRVIEVSGNRVVVKKI